MNQSKDPCRRFSGERQAIHKMNLTMIGYIRRGWVAKKKIKQRRGTECWGLVGMLSKVVGCIGLLGWP